MGKTKGAERGVALKKKPILDGGRIQLDFRGSVNLTAIGTTIAILGTFGLGYLAVVGIFILSGGK